MSQFVGVFIGIVCIIGFCQVLAFFGSEEEEEVSDQVNSMEGIVNHLIEMAFQSFDKDSNEALDKMELFTFLTYLTGKAGEFQNEGSTKKSDERHFENYEEIIDEEEEQVDIDNKEL